MDELLSLKWNNHDISFRHALQLLRKQDAYSDVTLACDGKFYNAHKFVLSTCSEYFAEIFERKSNQQLLIILKDIKSDDFEFLLDYMYIGQVNVAQDKLPSIIKAAKCLKIKGLAVAEDDFLKIGSESRKRKHSEQLSTSENIKIRTLNSSISCNIDVKNEQTSSPKLNEPLSKNKYEYVNNDMLSQDISDMYLPVKEEIRDDETQQNVEENSSDKFIDNLEVFPPFLNKYTNCNKSADEELDYLLSEDSLENSETELEITKTTFQKVSCSYCGKVFKSQWYLNRHIMIHTGKKPFKCPYCSYKANQKQSVIGHLKSRHLDRPTKPIIKE